MNKELILITAYCNTKEKKETLYNFLKSIQNFRDRYDILVASHLPIEIFYYDYFDYSYYDKNNNILIGDEHRFDTWYSPLGTNYRIWSNYIEVGNTLKAIWDLMIPSISMARSLNYEKIHCFEYDTIILDNDELIDNSKLLDDYDYVIYGNNLGTHKMLGSIFSFRVDGAIDQMLKFSDYVYNDMLKLETPRIPENVMYYLIKDQRKFIRKDHQNLEKNGIKTSFVRGNELNWNVPFYDPKTEKLKLFCRNTSKEIFRTTVIINGKIVLSSDILPTYWNTFDLIDNIKDIETLIILKNYNKTLEINFTNELILDSFKKSNYIEYKN